MLVYLTLWLRLTQINGYCPLFSTHPHTLEVRRQAFVLQGIRFRVQRCTFRESLPQRDVVLVYGTYHAAVGAFRTRRIACRTLGRNSLNPLVDGVECPARGFVWPTQTALRWPV